MSHPASTQQTRTSRQSRSAVPNQNRTSIASTPCEVSPNPQPPTRDGHGESGYPRGCGYPLTISAEFGIRIRNRNRWRISPGSGIPAL
ncbi:hypothetical protein PGTUg99_025398 [Puccinia graminis f. sp. tritici]|uniref:Uncharacterized protein n=1 Tax=Puccinia graminis f. sp. tritici TaxID=56615 RepID=A0A5B0N252_PUCGR|nr:hypothetical protein PGTUg99_025398 [Puccinia graminis f. sp. tritici]